MGIKSYSPHTQTLLEDQHGLPDALLRITKPHLPYYGKDMEAIKGPHLAHAIGRIKDFTSVVDFQCSVDRKQCSLD
ncbi:hypothetical protein Tco_0522675 [Tanacetum coccineum]